MSRKRICLDANFSLSSRLRSDIVQMGMQRTEVLTDWTSRILELAQEALERERESHV
jgi:hypothetical protein